MVWSIRMVTQQNTTGVCADSTPELETNTHISNHDHWIDEQFDVCMKDNPTDGLFAWQSPGIPSHPHYCLWQAMVSLGYHRMFVHCSNLSIFKPRSILFNNTHYVYDNAVSVDGMIVTVLRTNFTIRIQDYQNDVMYSSLWISSESRDSSMRSALFCDITQRWVVVLYRRFGTTYRSHLQRSRSPFGFLEPWR